MSDAKTAARPDRDQIEIAGPVFASTNGQGEA